MKLFVPISSNLRLKNQVPFIKKLMLKTNSKQNLNIFMQIFCKISTSNNIDTFLGYLYWKLDYLKVFEIKNFKSVVLKNPDFLTILPNLLMSGWLLRKKEVNITKHNISFKNSIFWNQTSLSFRKYFYNFLSFKVFLEF